MVGYNVIVGQTPDGEPIRLLGESVLNGTILMILATCTISTFATQRGAHNIAIKGVRENDESTEHQDEHILIPVSNEELSLIHIYSVSMIPLSRTGSIEPSTWVMLSFSKQRST